MKVLKTLTAATLAVAMTFGITACGGGNSNTEPSTGEPSTGVPITVEVVGTIAEDNMSPDLTASVSFNRFPANVEEFKQIRAQIGNTPQGAVALQLMAMEMYRFNQKQGEQALKLNGSTTNFEPTTRRLKELFATNSQDPQYAHPYQVAGFLLGANPQNGYTANRPYTVEVHTAATPMDESSIFQANVINLNVTCGGDKLYGFRTGTQVCFTQKPGEPNDGYIVIACPGLVSQVEPISYTATYPGLEH